MNVSRKDETASGGRPDGPGGEGEEKKWPAELSPQDAASYINDIALEMKVLAESAKLTFLAYLLDLAIEESALRKRGRL